MTPRDSHRVPEHASMARLPGPVRLAPLAFGAGGLLVGALALARAFSLAVSILAGS